MRLEALGVIGNCQFSALVHNSGEVVWCCLPRFDSEPVCSTLLDSQDGGHFRIGPASGESGTQRYLPNTNILETTFRTASGSFRVIDFAPRFLHFGRAFRPTQLFRIVEPIEGAPRIVAVCEPRIGWSKARPQMVQAGVPDAGIWEYRTEWKPQTFSSLMCWAAADRMAGIADLHQPALAGEFHAAAERIRDEVIANSWSAARRSFVGHYGGDDLDASLLQMVRLRFLPTGDARLGSTIDVINKDLARGAWLQRYSLNDGFGNPPVAFVICTFWLIEALAAAGRREEARAVFDRIFGALSPLGLLSEDFDPAPPRMWGNFPQTYSHVGLIHAAFAASPTWTDVL